MQDSSKEEKLFIQQNKLLFKKYKPVKLIGKGTFSNVYLAINTKTSNYVAIKAEKKSNNGVELLESEAYLLYSLRGFGIPEVLSYGRTKTHNILVLPLLGKSLLDMFIYKNKNINIDDICLMAIQILERIEWIHSNNIVYRDIKPENFLFGKTDNDVLYLIDFGLCRKYKSSKTGKHIPPKYLGKFTGTSRYASIYAMAGNEQSRRDDIESIGYMIIFFMKKKLPWQGIKGNSYKECYHKLYLMKKNIKLEDLCKGLPHEMIDYMKNARSLTFEQKPDYKYLKNLFNIIMRKKNTSFDTYILSWCKNNTKDSKERNKSNNKSERKSTPQNRLYKKLQKNIENKNELIPNQKYIEISEKNRINTINHFEKSIQNTNEITSELSNTTKVMFNKNINSINYGLNQSGINLPRINSEKNVYKNNILSFKLNNSTKNNLSPDNKINHYLTLNQDLSFKKNLKENKYTNKYSNHRLKKMNLQNNENKNRRIITISPIPSNRNIKLNNYENKNINNKKNKINNISQIKVIDVKTRNVDNKNNYQKKYNTSENIINNTYNNTIDKVINNKTNINNISQRKPDEMQNYHNYLRIEKIDNNKNLPNIINLKNYTKKGLPNLNNSNNHQNIIPLNKIINKKKCSSIETRPNSITQHFSYKNSHNNVNNKKNLKKNMLEINNSNQILGYNEKSNKIINTNNNSHLNKNKMHYIIKNINNNSIVNIKRKINSSVNIINPEEINNIGTPIFLNKTGEKGTNNHIIKYGENNIQSNIIRNKSLNSIEKETNNLKKNNLFNNKIYRKIPKDKYYSYNNFNNFSSIENSINNSLIHKKPQTTYIYKNKKGSNSIIIYNNNHNIYLSSNNSLSDINQKYKYNYINSITGYYNKNGIIGYDNKNTNEFFNIEPKIISNHSLKVINSSNLSTKKNNFPTNVSMKKYINTKNYDNNNYFENKYKTEEIDNLHDKNNNFGNTINRINKYKIVRNRGIQNN